MRICTSFIVVGFLVGAGAVPHAQSLADLAKKEEARRKGATSSGKMYGNKDLKPVAPPATPPPPPTSSAPSTTPSPPAEPPAPVADQGVATTATGSGVAAVELKDQAYWGGRMSALRDQLDRDRTYVEAMQSRVNALTTDFVNRDDPAQRNQISADRQRALTELERLKKAVEAGVKAIAALEEEARRAGVPPGWLR